MHGGIDGYSRMIVYLHASDNNRSDTVAGLFRDATFEFGVPSRARSDRGGENKGVAQLMETARGANRNSMLMGRSVHNQRIERCEN